MTRTKKSRASGSSEPKFDGARKENSVQTKAARDKKRNSKLKGNKAGNRNAVESKQSAQQNQRQAINDKRIGSTKSISLTPNAPAVEVAKPKAKVQVKTETLTRPVEAKISPEQELNELENSERLNDLLEKIEADEVLSKDDQAWVNKQMRRHQQLMKELGWIDEKGEEDLLQQFEDASSALDEFR